MALFLAGGIVTAVLLVVALVSLEQHSPVQSALPKPPTAPVTPAPAIDEPSSAAVPETFTFYETLEQRSAPSPGFIDKLPGPAPPPAVPSRASGVSPKKQPARYTVQVAAVKDQPTAEALAGRLRQKGYTVFVLPHVVPKRGVWYRVRVGHFMKRADAQATASRLLKQERLTTYIALE